MKLCGSQKGKLHLFSFLARQADILRRTLSLIEAAAGTPLDYGNMTRIYIQGPHHVAFVYCSRSHHFARFYNYMGHFLCRPHAVEVAEILTGLRLNSRLHDTIQYD
jgi:hypothetical protein